MVKSFDIKIFNKKLDDIIPFVFKDKTTDIKKINKLLFKKNLFSKLLKFYQKLKLNWEYHTKRKEICCITTTWKLSGGLKKVTFNQIETLKLFRHMNSNTYLNKILVTGLDFVNRCIKSNKPCNLCYCNN